MPPKSTVPVKFYWRHGGKKVFLTGSFDNWRVSIPMTRDAKGSDEFVATVYLNPIEKHFFKFVVDDVWRCSGEFPTENDPHGNVNNWRIPAAEKQQESLGDLGITEMPTVAALNAALVPGNAKVNGGLVNLASSQQQQQQQIQQQQQKQLQQSTLIGSNIQQQQRGIKLSQR